MRRSYAVWRAFWSDRRAAVAAVFLLVEIALVLFLPLFLGQDPNSTDRSAGFWAAPSAQHWLGTDDIHFDHDDQNRLYTVDSLQFAFAPEKDKNSKRTEIGLALMDGKPTIVRYSYAGGVSLLGIPDSALEYDLNKFVDTDYAVTNNGSETVYELKIPWGELFGPNFTVGSVGSVYFSALINDNDGNGRRGWIELCGGIGTVKDASEFTKIPLVK